MRAGGVTLPQESGVTAFDDQNWIELYAAIESLGEPTPVEQRKRAELLAAHRAPFAES